MSKYSNLFDETPKPNLFGEIKTVQSDDELESWIKTNGIKTSASRIKYVLNGIDPQKVLPTDILMIGNLQIRDASVANKQVDETVTNFAEMKGYLEAPKRLIIDASITIEGARTTRGLISRLFTANQPPDWGSIRESVRNSTDEALRKMQNCIKYRINPMIENLKRLRAVLLTIDIELDEVTDALSYLIVKSSDPAVQDLGRQKINTFYKSSGLMKMNIRQVDDMLNLCEQNKNFATELELTICPLIANVMRTSVINEGSDLQEIATKLKGIL